MNLLGVYFGYVFWASGARNFFGQGWWYHFFLRIWYGIDFSKATLISKTTTFLKRTGNMPLFFLQPIEIFPKCIYVDRAKRVALNAVGLSGPGFRRLLKKNKWQKIKRPFLLSFMAVEKTKEERLAEIRAFIISLRLELEKSAWATEFGLEINISCPNTEHDPKELVEEASELLKIARRSGLPIVLKINALVKIESALVIAESGLCDAIDVSNTIPFGELPDRIPWKKLFPEGSPLLKRGLKEKGGLSGEPLLEIVADWIREFRKFNKHFPLIGGGGILDARGVDVMFEAGATAISIGSIVMLAPQNIREVMERVDRYVRMDLMRKINEYGGLKT